MLDHLFICVDRDAEVADRLIAPGLVEGSANSHPGQGTTNRRFFFHNAMVELLWVDDAIAAQSAVIRRTRLWERWVNRLQGACPFGICLRSDTGDSDTGDSDTGDSDTGDSDTGNGAPIFSSWDYQPPYLPASMSIAVGTNSDRLTEPMLFQIPWGQRPDRFAPEKAQPINHPIGWREITRVTLVSPAIEPPSPEFQAVIESQQVHYQAGTEYRLELGYDRELQGQHLDFRPELPLVVNW